jgi:hypothetical protein
MGLHHTAHYLRSKGRGNDTMLVHMTPSEVKGLQALALRHGGSLTINPDTGLPEAGFLEQILPVIAAAGLTYLTAGAAAPTLTAALGGSSLAGGIAAGALSGAAISGGMAAIQGKDAGKAALMGGLGGAISGGMGAYDAANVFNAPNLLADASQEVAKTAGTDAAAEVAKKALGESAASAFPTVDKAGQALSIPDPNIPGGFISSETGQALASAPSGSGFTAGEMMAGSKFAPGTLPGGTGTAAEAVKTIGSSGSVTGPVTPSYYSSLGPDNYVQKGVIQSLPVLGLLEDERQQVGPQDNYVSPLSRLSPNFQAYTPPQPNPYYEPRRYNYASGGITSLQGGGGPVERMTQMNTAMNPQGGLYPQGMIDKTQYATPTQRPASLEMLDTEPAYQKSNPLVTGAGMAAGGVSRLPKGDAGVYKDTDPATARQDAFTAALTRLGGMQKKANIKGLPALQAVAKPLGNIEAAAKGGIMSSLGGYSDGGRMLKGPGDGMSDSIPASIGGKQPARLADGEFVVPADVVSHLGNGSTDAGAKRLYTMMDKIRKARTGKKKQAPAVKAERYMPA